MREENGNEESQDELLHNLQQGEKPIAVTLLPDLEEQLESATSAEKPKEHEKVKTEKELATGVHRSPMAPHEGVRVMGETPKEEDEGPVAPVMTKVNIL